MRVLLLAVLAAASLRAQLSLADARADVDQFFATLERVHPNLLARVMQSDYRSLREKTLSDLATQAKNGTVRQHDLEMTLSYAAAFFRDGHTSVRPSERPNAQNTAATRFPPFLLEFDNGAFSIVAALDETLRGAEVTAVNGVPVLRFLAPILDRCSGETLPFQAARFVGSQASWYFLTDLFRADACQLTLAGGRRQTVQTISFAEFTKLQPPQQVRETHVEFLEGGQVAHFVYPAFHQSDAEERKIDEVFRQIQERHAAELILDVRGNGGGNSLMGDYIFSYLYARKFRMFSGGSIKVSPDILARDGANMAKYQSNEGHVVAMHIREENHPRRTALFNGKTWLLVDNGTFSSAASFAALFRDYAAGTIVGYETGGLPTTFGDLFVVKLSHSGITCTVSHKQFLPPKPRPGDDRHGVLPDIPLNRSLLAPYHGQADPVLAYTLAVIRGKGRTP